MIFLIFTACFSSREEQWTEYSQCCPQAACWLVCVTLVKVSLGTVSWGAKCCAMLQFHWLFFLWDGSFFKTYESPVFITHLWFLPTGRVICWSCLPGLKSEGRGWVALCSGWALQELGDDPLKPSATVTWGWFLSWESPPVKHKAKPAFHQQLPPPPLLMMHDGPQKRWEHEGRRWDYFIKMFDLCCGIITIGSLHVENCVFWISQRAILPCRSARLTSQVMKVQLRQGSSLYHYLAVFWK